MMKQNKKTNNHEADSVYLKIDSLPQAGVFGFCFSKTLMLINFRCIIVSLLFLVTHNYLLSSFQPSCYLE